jgi:SPP1 family predicted phage head-tail adaptor
MIGKLDQRITFQTTAETPDGIGGTVRSWADLPATPTVWANAKARLGREAMVNGRMTAVLPVTFTIYNRADIDERCRIMWNGEAYNILSIFREGTRALHLQIDAQRGDAQ